jgi:predicted ATPase/DNA-binding SARP family transcriptional activator
MDLAIRLLGPVELVRDGEVVASGGPTQRAVLAMLTLNAGHPVAIDDLVDGIWGEREVSPGGRETIWPHISRIRATLRQDEVQPLATVGNGYRLDPTALSVDVHDFEHLLDVGREQLADGDADGALATFDRALALWRGPALMDVRDFPFASRAAIHYDELRVDAAEERIEACLALGEARSLAPELRVLVGDHPYRERLHGQLMLALYRSGQQAEALEAYRTARGRLTMDLGVEPGPELEHLHQQILQHAEELALPEGGSPSALAGQPGPQLRRRLPRARDLIGRDEQLRELERLAARERLITLTGPGGSGKTVLAVVLAHRLAPRFADGAAFVDLAAVRNPEQVIPAISDALGLSPSAGGSVSKLVEYLGERQVLVVLDNVEHVVQAAPDLEEIVAATGGLVLATSRAPLGLRDEYLVEVPPLPVPPVDQSDQRLAQEPAVQLFVRAAQGAGGAVGASPDELAAIGDICRAVDGLPLAIELAAAQTRVEAVQELAGHVREDLPRLQGRIRDAPARQQTLEAAIGWSIDLLATEDRPCLSRLTAFAGSFGASGAAAVCGLDRDRTIALLARLLDASLLTRRPAVEGRARFRLLDPVRTVVHASAEPALLGDAARRHAAFVAAEVDRLCPAVTGIQRPVDLSQLRLLHHDLMAAMAHLATADPDRCGSLLSQLDDYWRWTAREADARRIADELLRGGRLSDRVACAVLVGDAGHAGDLGQNEEAHRALDRALMLVGGVTDPGVNALVRMAEALWCDQSGDVPRARAAARLAVIHAQSAHLPWVLARSLALQAAFDAGFSATAFGVQGRLNEALRLSRVDPMPSTEAWVLFWIAVLDDQDLALAIHLERSALEICRRFGAPESALANGLSSNLAGDLLLAGRLDEARALALAALHAADRLGQRDVATITIELVGEVTAATGSAERAMVLITASRVNAARQGITRMWSQGERRRMDRVIADLQAQLGNERAAAARLRGEAMGYRESVGFAFEIDRLHPEPRTVRVSQPLGRRV